MISLTNDIQWPMPRDKTFTRPRLVRSMDQMPEVVLQFHRIVGVRVILMWFLMVCMAYIYNNIYILLIYIYITYIYIYIITYIYIYHLYIYISLIYIYIYMYISLIYIIIIIYIYHLYIYIYISTPYIPWGSSTWRKYGDCRKESDILCKRWFKTSLVFVVPQLSGLPK